MHFLKKNKTLFAIIFIVFGIIFIIKNKILLEANFKFSEVILFSIGVCLIFFENRLTRSKTYYLFIFTLLFALIYYSYKDCFSATWYIVDDHIMAEFQLFIKDRKKSFTEIFCKGTYGGIDAFCSPSDTIRYHPAAQIVHFLKQIFFAENHLYWFIEKFLVVSSSILLVFYLVSRFFGISFSFFFTIVVFSQKYFSSFFVMHMPSENYGLLSYAICTLCAYKLLSNKLSVKKYYFYWILLGIFTLIGIGMKENLIVLIFPIWLVMAFDIYERKINFLNLFFSISSILLVVLIIYSVLVNLSKSGQDIYSRDTSPASRIPMLFLAIKTTKFYILSLVIIFAIAISGKFLNILKNFSYRNLIIFSSIQIYNLTNYYFQFVFYNAEIPAENRYDFPGTTVFPFFWIINFYYLSCLVKEYYFINYFSLNFKKGITVGYLLLAILNPFNDLKIAAYNQKLKTNDFTNRLGEIIKKVKQNPEWVISFESYDPLDFEPLYSTNYFLRLYGVKNPISYRTNNFNLNNETGFRKMLASSLISCTNQASCIGGAIKALPKDYDKCYSVFFSSEVVKNNCEGILKINYY